MTALLLEGLDDLLDEQQLEMTADSGFDNFSIISLVQGNDSFEKDATLNKTVRYTGGIGFKVDENLPDDIANAPDATIVTTSFKDKTTDYMTFQSMEVVVLGFAKIARFYGEVDGKRKLICGTNKGGVGATGWSGYVCKACPNHKSNFQGTKEEKSENACQNSIAALVYVPRFKKTCLLIGKGMSYVPTSDMLDELMKLQKRYVQIPEVKAKYPTLPRANSYFFKMTLFASDFQQGDSGKYNVLAFKKAETPIAWEQFMNTPAVIREAKEAWDAVADHWKKEYVEEKAFGDQPQNLLGTTAAVVAGELPATSSATVTATVAAAPQATEVELDDTEDAPVAAAVSVSDECGF